MDYLADANHVAEVDRASAQWCQGDIVDFGVMSWWANRELPLSQPAESIAKGDRGAEMSTVYAEADALVIVSQTCDIVRDARTRPFVQLARLVRLTDQVAAEARRGTRPRFVPVPGAGLDAFCDLDVIVTAEKSLLTRWQRRVGLPTEIDRRRFGRAVGRSYSRFAFPDDLHRSLQPMVRRIRERHDRDSPEGRALSALEEIRVTGAPSWSAPAIEVFIVFAPPSASDAAEIMTDEEWDQIVDEWVARAEPHGVVRSVDGAMIPLDELTAREYTDSDLLDLDHLSWPAA